MDLRHRLTRLEAWFTPRRMAAAALVVLAANLLASAVWLATQQHLLDRFHQPMGGDFIIFYAASSLTLKGVGVRFRDAGRSRRRRPSPVGS
jgi:hypothetical protein